MAGRKRIGPNHEQVVVPSPLQKLVWKPATTAGVDIYVKRDDLIHSYISGNKWRKLKYNLAAVRGGQYAGIVTFGGAFSNHIHATAAAGHYHGFKTVGIIRGEPDVHNPTLSQATQWGMQLHYVSRSSYREKEASPEVQKVLQYYPNYLLLPEGGSNRLATKGTAETIDEVNQEVDCSHFVVSAGTGATAAGMITRLLPHQHLLVVSALKGDFLQAEINTYLDQPSEQWTLLTDYHRGGYGKTDSALIDFINTFYAKTAIPLDPIYNGKSIWGLADLLNNGGLEDASGICYIHTGGLQGVKAYDYMAAKKGRTLITEYTSCYGRSCLTNSSTTIG